MQRVISFIESGHVIHVRRADQLAIKPVGPRMIRTLNRGCVSARVFFQTGPAMTTDIVKSSNFGFRISNYNEALSRHLNHEVVAGVGDLTLMSYKQPIV